MSVKKSAEGSCHSPIRMLRYEYDPQAAVLHCCFPPPLLSSCHEGKRGHTGVEPTGTEECSDCVRSQTGGTERQQDMIDRLDVGVTLKTKHIVIAYHKYTINKVRRHTRAMYDASMEERSSTDAVYIAESEEARLVR